MASYGGQQQDAYGSPSQQQQQQQQPQMGQPNRLIMNPQTGLPQEFHEQLTSQEVDTLSDIMRNAKRIRSTGAILGSSAVFVYMLRKKRNIVSFRGALNCFGGSLLGSWLSVPVGVSWSTRKIKQVDNPDHLTSILANAQNARMKAARDNRPIQIQRLPPQGGPPPTDPAAQSMSSSSQQTPAPPPMPSRYISRSANARNKGPQTNQWGDEINGPEMTYSPDEAANTPPASSFSAGESGSAPSPSGMTDNEAVNPSQSQSRWAQLRGQRQVQESSWDKIRQENARDAYNRQAASGQGRLDQGAFSSQGSNYAGQNSADMADPTFGKGSSPTRTQAQREYERSFERERKGVDG